MQQKFPLKDGVLIIAVGKDKPGLVANVTSIVSELKGNIEDMDQVVLRNVFVMSLIVRFLKASDPHRFAKLNKFLIDRGEKIGLKVNVYPLKTL